MWYFWIRRQVRRFMKPIPLARAERNDALFTFLYVCSGGLAFIYTAYRIFANKKIEEAKSNRSDGTSSSGPYYGRIQHSENMIMYRLERGQLHYDGRYSYSQDESVKKKEDDFFGEED